MNPCPSVRIDLGKAPAPHHGPAAGAPANAVTQTSSCISAGELYQALVAAAELKMTYSYFKVRRLHQHLQWGVQSGVLHCMGFPFSWKHLGPCNRSPILPSPSHPTLTYSLPTDLFPLPCATLLTVF